MLTLELLQKMLLAAAVELKDKSLMLCELDGVCGDGDHGLTIARIADAINEKIAANDSTDIKGLLDDLSMAFMNTNGGSAGPLWGTVFEGMAEGVEEGVTELDEAGIHAMLEGAKDDFECISKAKIGDKTMVDALYPALDAGMAATGDAKAIFTAMAEAAVKGADATADMVARFGRAKNLGERSLGTKDPGAVSLSILYVSMAQAL
ncbi:dihydroxyacetone kinase subunit DhaL [Phascolarctobacterium sp.]|uniref:dihydroxyacetone kinase subunit DhaL n=1 Tax=Phascolarctobacterium sp. TaxID=2049039 RepID=UPI00386AF4EB